MNNLINKIGNRPRMKSNLDRLSELNSKYIIKKAFGSSPTIGETEAHAKYEQYMELLKGVSEIPEWFDGPCSYLETAIETQEDLDKWELEIILNEARLHGRFSSSMSADRYIRILRAKRFLIAVSFEIEALGNKMSCRRLDLLKLMEQLEKSIKNGKGIPRTGRKIIERKLRWEEKQYSQSINWNSIIKVPRIG